MKCGTCQRDIADGSNFCPYCGSTQQSAAPPQPQQPYGGQTMPPPQPPYGQQPPLSGPVLGNTQQPGYGAPPGGVASQRATMSMVLGIAGIALSVLGCCCYGFPSLVGGGLGIAAFIMGKNELEDILGGFAPPAGEGPANTGKITGMIAMGIGGLVFAGWVVGLILMVASEIAK